MKNFNSDPANNDQSEEFLVVPWDIGRGEFEGMRVDLVTPEHLKRLPEGTELFSILGIKKTVGVDNIDGDAPLGFLSVGLPSRAIERKSYYRKFPDDPEEE